MKAEILARYAERTLPRYTSYPTAPHFAPAIGPGQYRSWLEALAPGSDVSLYLHVPFCRQMCWYCGCNTNITPRDEPISRYLDALEAEIDLVAEAIPGGVRARHVHFGGGTPTLMPPARFLALMERLRGRFALADDAEIAIEIDPRTLTTGMTQALAEGGVTRASLGVQSFDPAVQRAIGRIQSFEQTRDAVHGLRDAGIGAINFDLIYGLPRQDIASCLETASRAVSLAPDRFAVFGYAHVPTVKRHQRKITEAALPGARGRHGQVEAIAAALQQAGYARIGLDHFARPHDALARAQAEGTLHRNFQGYTTDACDTLIGLGASAIGRLGQGYVQNVVATRDYERRIADGELATGKGAELAAEDRLRAAVIERIMCDARVDLDEVCARHGGDPSRLVATAKGLDQLVADGIARIDRHRVSLSENARPLVRVLAAAFDQYLGEGPARHSRAV